MSATSKDRSAIFEAVENWRAAWERSDSRLATRDYAEDADWTNAFGVTCNSRAELESTLAHISRFRTSRREKIASLGKKSAACAPMSRW